MDREEALRLLRGGKERVDEWNRRRAQHEKIPPLAGAELSKANLDRANLSGAFLHSADLNGANLTRANLGDAKLTGANLGGANLSGADLCMANLSFARLNKANLTDSDLSWARLIRCDLSDAIVENALVWHADIQDLRGLPRPPNTLRTGELDETILTGHGAATFFVRPEKVEIVLDRMLADKALAAYHLFIAETKALGQWPKDVAFIGGRVENNETILSYEAPKAADVVSNLSILLQPFRLAEAVDWQKTIEGYSTEQAEPIVTALLAKSDIRNIVAERLRYYQGFEDAKPVAVRTPVKSFAMELIQEAIKAMPSESNLIVPIFLAPVAERHMGNNYEIGGDAIGAFGPGASFTAHDVTVYKQRVDRSTLDDQAKEKLKEAGDEVGKLDLSEASKNDAADDLGKLTHELLKPEPEGGRVKRLWNRIKEIAPTVATILQAAETIAKFLPK
ncbi:MAG: pentapeptide repeat-containing protein [Planctomycetota bacterium]|jgi:hypothetical protein